MNANIDYLAPNGAPDNDRKSKERGLLTSQAFVESLRYYPSRAEGDLNRDCEVAYSGRTHTARQSMAARERWEELEDDVRRRIGLLPSEEQWRPDQVHVAWAKETPTMQRRLAAYRTRWRALLGSAEAAQSLQTFAQVV